MRFLHSFMPKYAFVAVPFAMDFAAYWNSIYCPTQTVDLASSYDILVFDLFSSFRTRSSVCYDYLITSSGTPFGTIRVVVRNDKVSRLVLSCPLFFESFIGSDKSFLVNALVSKIGVEHISDSLTTLVLR